MHVCQLNIFAHNHAKCLVRMLNMCSICCLYLILNFSFWTGGWWKSNPMHGRLLIWVCGLFLSCVFSPPAVFSSHVLAQWVLYHAKWVSICNRYLLAGTRVVHSQPRPFRLPLTKLTASLVARLTNCTWSFAIDLTQDVCLLICLLSPAPLPQLCICRPFTWSYWHS